MCRNVSLCSAGCTLESINCISLQPTEVDMMLICFPVSILIYNPFAKPFMRKASYTTSTASKESRDMPGPTSVTRLFHRFHSLPTSCRECVRLCNSPISLTCMGMLLPWFLRSYNRIPGIQSALKCTNATTRSL